MEGIQLLEIEDWSQTRLAAPEAAHFTVDADRRVVIVRFGKRVSFPEIKEYAEKLLAHPLFRPNYSEIVDLSHVEELQLDAEQFIKLADEVDPFSIEAKRAFVVNNSVQAHAARMHKVLRTQRHFSIFHSLDEADRWLRE